jgi:hypothetical protein
MELDVLLEDQASLTAAMCLEVNVRRCYLLGDHVLISDQLRSQCS